MQQAVPQPVQDQLRHSLYLAECTTYVPLLGPDCTLEKLSASSSAPDGAVGIRVRKAGKPEVTLYFDKDSGLLAELDCEEPGEKGGSARTSTRYSGYRNFSGLMCPTVSKYLRGRNTSSTSTMETVEPLNQYFGNVFNAPPKQ